MESHNDNSDRWGEPVHVYTRAQAIADGILVDLTTATDDHGQLLLASRVQGEVAITRTAWAKTVEAGGTWKPTGDGETLELKGGQSLTGRLWDLLWMLKLASGRASNTDRVHFLLLVDVQGDGLGRVAKLGVACVSDR
jgi:hypothetical protein